MEEILASIRRIISEEDQPGGAPEPVLELNQPATQEQEDDIVFEEEEEKPVAQAPAPKPAPAPAPVATAPRRAAVAAPPSARVVEIEPPTAEAQIISDQVASIAASAFTKLASSVRVADSAGQTLEGIIRQLVRPLLKEWLDENLPAIVEAKVEAELERIARLAR